MHRADRRSSIHQRADASEEREGKRRGWHGAEGREEERKGEAERKNGSARRVETETLSLVRATADARIALRARISGR